VGDDSAGFDPLIAAFKKNPVYKDTAVSVSKFASYEDYERTLINVIADGNSPDVFVVPSTGAGLLESKTEPIPDSLFDQNDLSRNLSKLFDPLIMINPGKSADGKNIQVTTLK
jgi:ABC-type glycerol-3-phosphate transport system substrate-binding protein